MEMNRTRGLKDREEEVSTYKERQALKLKLLRP